MMVKNSARIAAFAFSFLILSLGSAFAHSLPGSVLTFWRAGDHLLLSIRLPLEDLTIANTAMDVLESREKGVPLSATDMASLAAYLSEHLVLRLHDDSALTLNLTSVTLELDENEHVGAFTSLALELSAPVTASDQIFPMELTYDAVMHEVRNHRAAVYWGKPDNAPTYLTDFGFLALNGKQQPVLLQNP
jgi:hypothetical protein